MSTSITTSSSSGTKYSVPFQLLREQVEVRYTTTTVEVFKGRRVTVDEAG